MNENIVSQNNSLGILIKLKDPTQPSNSIHEQTHAKIVDTLNFLIYRNFENKEVTIYNKKSVIKTTLTFKKADMGVVREILDSLIYISSISNWIMEYVIEDDVDVISDNVLETIIPKNLGGKESIDDETAEKLISSLDSFTHGILTHVTISLMYCENALSKVIKRNAEIKEISDMTNLVVNKDLDPKVASEIRKKFHVEGFDELTKRLDDDSPFSKIGYGRGDD